jgi:hypothetical protein
MEGRGGGEAQGVADPKKEVRKRNMTSPGTMYSFWFRRLIFYTLKVSTAKKPNKKDWRFCHQ